MKESTDEKASAPNGAIPVSAVDVQDTMTEETTSIVTQDSFSQSQSAEIQSKQHAEMEAEMECPLNVGDEVDINSLSDNVFGPTDNLVVVKLVRPSYLSNDEIENVVSGKLVVAVVRSNSPGTTQSKVIWRMPRDKIGSLNLVMAQNKAVLDLPVGTKSLVFQNAEDCLVFANGFYQTSLGPLPPPSERQSVQAKDPSNVSTIDPPAPAAPPVPVPPIEASHNLTPRDSLSAEEQAVLERYREAKRKNGSDDAIHVTIGSQAVPPAAPPSGLTADEEKTASKFRKMLKMRIPPDAVRHKMTMEQVPEKIIDAVMNNDAPTSSSQASTTASSASSGLSEEEEKTAQVFRKMLKLRIPPEAVRHKMNKEQVPQKVIDAVLNEDQSAPSTSDEPEPIVSRKKKNQVEIPDDLTEEEKAEAASYKKMLKMMIPPEAVKHKMKKEQASTRVIFAVFPDDKAKAEEESAGGGGGVRLTAAEKAIAAKFEKMLKMRIPSEAVRHKMTKENVDNKIIMVVLGDSSSGEPEVAALNADEEKKVAVYRKMLQMRIPEEAVKHKMMKEGVAQKIIDALFGAVKSSAKKIKPKPKSKLVSLHWTPLSGEELNKSVWRASKKRRMSGSQPEGTELSTLVELFQKKTNKKGVVNRKSTGSASGDGMAKLVDINQRCHQSEGVQGVFTQGTCRDYRSH